MPREATQFKAGNPGRPKGARNKLGEDFIKDLAADWAEHGRDVLKAVREKSPDTYMRVVASLLPKTANLNLGVDQNLVELLSGLTGTREPPALEVEPERLRH